MREDSGVERWLPAQGGDDLGLDAAHADRGVRDVDDLVAGCFELCQGCSDGDGLAGAGLAGDYAHLALGDAPLDPGDRLACPGCGCRDWTG